MSFCAPQSPLPPRGTLLTYFAISFVTQLATLLLSWTVAAAVFDFLDIFATLWYDAESQQARISAIFSGMACAYGLIIRRGDLLDMRGLGFGNFNRARRLRLRRRRNPPRATEDTTNPMHTSRPMQEGTARSALEQV